LSLGQVLENLEVVEPHFLWADAGGADLVDAFERIAGFGGDGVFEGF
jgi:hypothetical protein